VVQGRSFTWDGDDGHGLEIFTSLTGRGVERVIMLERAAAIVPQEDIRLWYSFGSETKCTSLERGFGYGWWGALFLIFYKPIVWLQISPSRFICFSSKNVKKKKKNQPT
jgi:hypothetical protein